MIKLDFLTIIIVTNDDIDTANGVFDSRLIFTPTTSGTYYLSAGSYSANPNKDNSGAYSLTVTLTKETTPTDPTTPTTPDPGVGPDIEGTNRSETVNGTEQGETISGLGGGAIRSTHATATIPSYSNPVTGMTTSWISHPVRI